MMAAAAAAVAATGKLDDPRPHAGSPRNSSDTHHHPPRGDAATLVALLQECVPWIQQNTLHPILRTTLVALQTYIERQEKAAATTATTTAPTSTTTQDDTSKPVNDSTGTDDTAQKGKEEQSPISKELKPCTSDSSTNAISAKPSPDKFETTTTENVPFSDKQSTAMSHSSSGEKGASSGNSPTTPVSTLSSTTPNTGIRQQTTPMAPSTKTPTPPTTNSESKSAPFSSNAASLAHLPPEVRLEQQKKLAAERRRQDLELQRRLARTQQRHKDLHAKRNMLLTDQRKQELLISNLTSAGGGGGQVVPRPLHAMALDPRETLQQIKQQIRVIDEDMRKVKVEITSIQAEQEERKKQALAPSLVIARETRTHTGQSARSKQQLLEAQKRAAQEKRRAELEAERRRAREEIKRKEAEKRRQFLEHERRKQKLMEEAKAGYKNGVENADILEKLNKHVSQFDAEKQKQDKDQASETESAADASEKLNFSASTPLNDSIPAKTPPEHSLPENLQSSQNATASSEPNQNAEVPQTETTSSEPYFPSASPNYNQHHPPSGKDQKYMKMATQQKDGEGEEDPTLHTELKRSILFQWALQPPHWQHLRPIYELLCTVQTVYPPANGLELHEYFDGWEPISYVELQTKTPHVLDEKKLGKAMRKLRFFLHPDKRPHDLTDAHQFVCKLLWDVTNDAWEDHKKAKEELDWAQS